MTDDKWIYTREFYRLEYPSKERISLKSGDLSYEVVNISEKGAKLLDKSGEKLDPEKTISGTVTFHNGETIEVEGTILRILDQGYFVILFSKRIPFSSIMKEQRYLMERYKHLFM